MANERIERIMQDLKTRRDDLNVQMHLAKAELKDEWEELEDKMEYAENKFAQLRKEGEDAAEEAYEALMVITDELSDAYKRIRKRLKKAS